MITSRSGAVLIALFAALPSTFAQSLPQPAVEMPVTSPALVCGCPTGTSKGDISITTAYQNIRISKHFLGTGEAVSRGRIRADTLALSIDYSLTDRLAASASLPYVMSAYHGTFAHQLPIDDGQTHGSYQDYRLDVRYALPFAPVSLTPFAGVIIPSHDYTYFGHSAAGRDLHEQFAGINAGRSLEPVIPHTYAQVRYAYTLSQKVLAVSHNRSNLDADLSYFLVPAVSVRAIWSLQRTYSSLNIDNLVHSGPLWVHHDQILRDDYLNVGTGIAWAVNEDLDIFAVALKTLQGRNGHKIDLSTNAGVTWTFHPRRR